MLERVWSASRAGVRGAGVRPSSLRGQLLRGGIGPRADHTLRPPQVCIVWAILPSEPRGMFRFAAFRVLEQSLQETGLLVEELYSW